MSQNVYKNVASDITTRIMAATIDICTSLEMNMYCETIGHNNLCIQMLNITCAICARTAEMYYAKVAEGNLYHTKSEYIPRVPPLIDKMY